MSSWFGFGAPKSNLPAATPLQDLRSKQIESLRNLNPNVVELKRDEEYRVGFNCGSNHVTFTIYLPPEFPQTKPIITVAPIMRHGFLDESMKVVRYLPLINFNVQTDLGRLIQTLIQDFSKSPMFIQPEVAQQRGMPTVPQYQHFMPQPSSTTSQQQQQLAPLQQPPTLQSHPHHPIHQTPPQPHTHQPSPPPPHHQQPSSHNMPMPYPSAGGGAAAMHPTPSPNQFMPQMQVPPPAVSTVSSFPSMSSIPTSSSSSSSSSSSAMALTRVNGVDIEPNMPVPGMTGIRGLHDGHPYNMPAIPPSYDDIFRDFSQRDLQELLEDEEKLDAVFRHVPQLTQMLTDRAKLYQSCEEIAKLNLSYKPEIESRKRELEETVKFRNDLKNSFDMKCLQQQSLNEQCTPHHLLDNMRVSAADAEHQSDELAERFLEDKVTLEDFLKQFSEQRKLLHTRRVREEKLSQVIQSQGRY